MQVYMHMVSKILRSYWVKKIESAWQEKSIVWLTGVRRSGKTTLAQFLTPKNYYDCELPRVRKLFDDPELFFKNITMNQSTPKITIDEIHRLENASEVLKIGADYFPNVKIIATGSSSLGASKKFKDTLTDRKREIFLTPLNLFDLGELKGKTLNKRLFHGGLPPFFLAPNFPESSYQEWIDSFWAKDIQELFQLEKKHAFFKMMELLAIQSGGLFEAQSFSAPCGVSHTTIAAYLKVMEKTHIAYVLRPFHGNQAKEIITAPKVYFFDTGFINFFKGLVDLNPDDLGKLWEHLVLNELMGFIDRESIHIWRDKTKNEVDFVIKLRGKSPIAIECKWKEKEFDPHAISKFREIHPDGHNILIASDSESILKQNYRVGKKMLLMNHCPLNQLKELFDSLK